MELSLISGLMTKKDWTAIFSASCILIMLLLLSLVGKVMIWTLVAIFTVCAGFAFYMAFVHKYSVPDDELEGMLSDLKNTMFGGKKNV